MFDVGFSELLLVFVVALIVIGPERLPRVARAAGLWIGRMRAFVSQVKEDIDRELAAEDLKRSLREDKDLAEVRDLLEQTKGDTRRAADALRRELDQPAAPEQAEEETSTSGTANGAAGTESAQAGSVEGGSVETVEPPGGERPEPQPVGESSAEAAPESAGQEGGRTADAGDAGASTDDSSHQTADDAAHERTR